MKKEKVCSNCGRTETFQKMLPRICEKSNDLKHKFRAEKVCACNHTETSHLIRHGLVQCSIGDCFPYSRIKHNVSPIQ